MDRAEVSSFVERARAAIENAPAMGSRNTQLRVAEPFLSVLGWDVRSSSVEAAYAAADGAVVDYALCPTEQPGAFVSVAACSDSLSTQDRDVLVSSMRASNVSRGVYTNGRQYLLLAVDATGAANEGDEDADDGVEQVRLALADLPDHVAALRALEYETIASLAAGEKRRAANSLVARSDEAVAAVTEAVVGVAGEDVAGDVEPLARRFLDAVVDDLAPRSPETADSTEPPSSDAAETPKSVEGKHSDAAANSATSKPAAAAGTQTKTQAESSTGDSEGASQSSDLPELGESSGSDGSASDSEYAIRFFDDGRSIAAVGSPDVDSAMAQGVQYLLEERGVGPRLEFPYAPGDTERAFLHREPLHPDGSEMETGIDLGGLYLYTGQDVAAKRERVETLAERGGLRAMFTGDWD